MVKRLIISCVIISMLSGCFSTKTKVVLVETDVVPGQVVDERPVLVRFIDPATKEEVTLSRPITGVYFLPMDKYKKLVEAALENKK
jgi:hypothetical protein